MIATPGGKVASNQVPLSVPLEIGSKTFPTNLVTMNLEGVDVILGMNWMSQHKVVLDFRENVRNQLSSCREFNSLPLPNRS
jgi:hypothetical protein